MDIAFNTAGMTGMVMMLAAYFLQQSRGVGAALYSWLNFVGALLMIVSLMHFWNLASFLLELAWASISLASLVRLYAKKWKMLYE